MLNYRFRTAIILVIIFFLVIAVSGTVFIYWRLAFNRAGNLDDGQKTAEEGENVKTYELENLTLKNCPAGMPDGIPPESGIEIIRSQSGQGTLSEQDQSLSQTHILCTYKSKLDFEAAAEQYKKYFSSRKVTPTVLADTPKLNSSEGRLDMGTLNVSVLQANRDTVMVSLDFMPVAK
ncbi:MAG: hypothetical protein M1275_02785 [Patescibacteria group bacterium]|nr:hypothetical protein [Patescibacteria group bacterium]